MDAPCTFGRTSGTACIRELGPTASTPCACAQRGHVRGVSAALIRPHTRSPHLRLACASFPPTTRSCLPREARTRLGLAATDVDAALGLASPRARPRDRPRSNSASDSAATDFELFSKPFRNPQGSPGRDGRRKRVDLVHDGDSGRGRHSSKYTRTGPSAGAQSGATRVVAVRRHACL